MRKCKMISKVIVFILLFVIIYGKVSSVLSIGNNMTATVGAYRSFYTEPKNSHQIITLGNSRMYSSWNSLQLWENSGIASYCISTGNQPAVMVKYLMEEVRKTQENPLFIIDISCFRKDQIYMMNDINIRRVIDCMPFSDNKVKMIEATLKLFPKTIDYQIEKAKKDIEQAESSADKAKHEAELAELLNQKENVSRMNYYWNFSQYHSRWSELSKSDFTKEGNPYKSVYYEELMFQAKEIKVPKLTTKCSNLDATQKNIIDDLLSYIKENRLNVLFVSLPASLNTKFLMELNGIRELIVKNGSVCLDFNTKNMYEKIGIDFKTDFWSKDHTNNNGSRKVMQYMTSYLKDHYSLEDQRGVAGYESWDQAVEDYAEYVIKMQQENKE